MNILFAGLGLSDSVEGNSSASMGTGEHRIILSKDNAHTSVPEQGFSGAYRYALGIDNGTTRSATKLLADLPSTGKYLPVLEDSGDVEGSAASVNVFELATDVSLILEESDGPDDQSLVDVTDTLAEDLPWAKSDDAGWTVPIQNAINTSISMTDLSGTPSIGRSGADTSPNQPLSLEKGMTSSVSESTVEHLWNSATFPPLKGISEMSEMNGDYPVQKAGQNPDRRQFARTSVLPMLPVNSQSRATSLPETAPEGPADDESGAKTPQGNERVSVVLTKNYGAIPAAGGLVKKQYGESASSPSSSVSKGNHTLPTGEQANRQHDPSRSSLAGTLDSMHKLAPEPTLTPLAAGAGNKVMDVSRRRGISVAAQPNSVSFSLAEQNLAGGKRENPIEASGENNKSFQNATTQPMMLGKQRPELEPRPQFIMPSGEGHNKPNASLGPQPGTENGVPALSSGQASPQVGAAYNAPQAGMAPRQQEIGVPLGHEAWEQNLANQVLQAGKKQFRQLHIKLNPSHLGSLDIKLRVEGESASIAFSSQHAVVREAVEASLPRLREMFAATGMNLGDVDVGGQDTARGQQQEPQEGHFTAEPMPPMMEKEDSTPAVDMGQRPSKRGAEEPGLDIYA